jgi:hypothetical protein
MTRPELDAVRGVLTAHGWTRWTEVDGPEDTRDDEGNVIAEGVAQEGVLLLGQTDETQTWGRPDPDGDIWLAPRAAPEVSDAKDRAVEALAAASGTPIRDNYAQSVAFRL